jgi:hypothetical protein
VSGVGEVTKVVSVTSGVFTRVVFTIPNGNKDGVPAFVVITFVGSFIVCCLLMYLYCKRRSLHTRQSVKTSYNGFQPLNRYERDIFYDDHEEEEVEEFEFVGKNERSNHTLAAVKPYRDVDSSSSSEENEQLLMVK